MKRAWAGWLVGTGAVLLTAACGGKVESSGGNASAGAGAGGGSSTSYGGSSHALGPCPPGTQPYQGNPCPWLADGECYPSVDEACNCACPRDHASTCVSGFPKAGDQGMVPVTCY